GHVEATYDGVTVAVRPASTNPREGMTQQVLQQTTDGTENENSGSSLDDYDMQFLRSKFPRVAEIPNLSGSEVDQFIQEFNGSRAINTDRSNLGFNIIGQSADGILIAFDGNGQLKKFGSIADLKAEIEKKYPGFQKIEGMAAVLHRTTQLSLEEWQSMSIEEIVESVTKDIPLSAGQRKLIAAKIDKMKNEHIAQAVGFREVIAADPQEKLNIANDIFRHELGTTDPTVKLDFDAEIRIGSERMPSHIIIVLDDRDFARLIDREIAPWEALTPEAQERFLMSNIAGMNSDDLMGNVSFVPKSIAENPAAYQKFVTHEETHYMNKFMQYRDGFHQLGQQANSHFEQGNYEGYLEAKFQQQLNWTRDEITAYLTDPSYLDDPKSLLRARWSVPGMLAWSSGYTRTIRDAFRALERESPDAYEKLKHLEQEYRARYEAILEEALIDHHFTFSADALGMLMLTPLEQWPKVLEYLKRTPRTIPLEATPTISDDLRRQYKEIYEETNDEVLFTVLHKEITEGEITPQALRALHELFHSDENGWKPPEGLDPLQARELFAQKIAEMSGLSVDRAKQLIPMVQGGYLADAFHAFWGKWFGLEPSSTPKIVTPEAMPERHFEGGDLVGIMGGDGVKDKGWMVMDKQPAPRKYTLVKVGPDARTKAEMEITEKDLLRWNPDGPIKIIENSDQIIQEAYRKSPQFALTDQLIRGRMFKVQGTINIGGTKFHISPIIRVPDGRLCCVMMVDFGDGKLFPRIVYKSHSEGGWRSPRGTKDQADKQGRISPVYKKGLFKEAYTHETKVATEIADYLDIREEAARITNVNFNPMETYFHENNPSLAETDTYGRDATDPYAEVKVAPESNLFWRFRERGYQPGGISATNASDYFRSLDNYYPPGFIPDFSRGPIKQPVKRTHDLFGKIKTIVETYRGYLNGRAVNWEIVREDTANANYQGRVWIGGIGFSSPQINSYGTNAEILLTGVLSHKPAEYNDYTTGLKYGSERIALDPRYDDITPLLDNLRPIREFRQARGIYRQPPGQQQGAK
ncbi:MAG: hypothetical protein WC604_04290, partial [Candidatus Gracilibacteria bacterium]